MMGVKELTKVVGLPVTGQGVLGQIIGAYREEIHLFRQLLGKENGDKSLDHDADLCILPVRDTLLVQFRQDLLASSLVLLYLPHRGDYWKHNGDFSVGRSSVQRAKLRAEDLRRVQTDADGPNAQSEIFFLLKVKIIHL